MLGVAYTIRKTKTIVLTVLLLLGVTVVYSCNSNVIGPADSVAPGRRDYVWTVDTLNNLSHYNRYTLIYGTSPSNIWCLGQGVFSTSFLHYDGKGWRFVDYNNQGSGLDPWSVFGLSPDDFWIGGAENMIWRCKNEEITKYGVYPIKNFGDVYYLGFCGSAGNDIYSCGSVFSTKGDSTFGILMHFNGTGWEYINKPKIPGYFLKIVKGEGTDSVYFIDTYILDSKKGSLLEIYKFDGKNFSKIYSEPEELENGVGYMKVDDRLYFGFKKKIYRYENNSFIPCVDLTRFDIQMLAKLTGRSLKDFFLNMNGGIGHYNGTDIAIIYKCSDGTAIESSLILEKDVYFLLHEWANNKNLLLHGKLKD